MTPEPLSTCGPYTASNVDKDIPIGNGIEVLWAFDPRMDHAARRIRLDKRRFELRVPPTTPEASSP